MPETITVYWVMYKKPRQHKWLTHSLTFTLGDAQREAKRLFDECNVLTKVERESNTETVDVSREPAEAAA